MSKYVHYVTFIEGHGDVVQSEEIKSLEEAKRIATVLNGKVGIREGKWEDCPHCRKKEL